MAAILQTATDPTAWDAFLASRRFSPFLQSWTMGEVYRDIGQEPVRLEVRDDGKILGLCFAHVVPARRGRHLSVPYGPVSDNPEALRLLIEALTRTARDRDCAFVRLSPFWPSTSPIPQALAEKMRPSPLHLLAEHLWYIPLETPDPWTSTPLPLTPVKEGERGGGGRVSEQDILKDMRPTARNLIRRAQKEGVTVARSADPVSDLTHFLTLHDETRKRHGFTPYSTAFFRAQISHFAPRGEISLYLARYREEVIATSIHVHFAGETSYHHGASTQKYRNIPASYLLQWTAISDALRRGDRIYNFWGISPEGVTKHPFAGVRTFKTAFGGKLLDLTHCVDIPLSRKYLVTLGIEKFRKWRRGF